MLKALLLPLLLSLPLLLFPAKVSAVEWTEANGCVVGTGDEAVATIQGIECIVTNFLNIAITIIGLGVFAMILFGAFQYLTSQGDPKAAEAGKQTITYAVVGLVLAISAWFILNLISGFTGLPQILQFNTQI